MSHKKRIPVRMRHLGISAFNRFQLKDSSARGFMTNSQMGNLLLPYEPDTPTLITGLEREMAKCNFNHKLENKSKILKIMPYYPPNVDQYTDDYSKAMFIDIIYYDYELNTIDLERVFKWGKKDKKFGYVQTLEDVTLLMEEEDVLPANTKLTSTNSDKDGVYSHGVEVNILPISIGEVGEDAMVVSDELMKRLKYPLFSHIHTNAGNDRIPLNIFGDDDAYKILPDYGEKVKENGVVMAIREVDPMFAHVLMSKDQLKEISPLYDDVYRIGSASGVIEDINIIYTPQTKNKAHVTKAFDHLRELAEHKHAYNKNFIETCKELKRQFTNVEFGNTLHVTLVRLQALEHPKVKNKYMQDPANEFEIDIVVKYDKVPHNGIKLTTTHGSKGIVSMVLPKEEMPVDANGLVADMMFDPSSSNRRMNMGNPAEGFVLTTVTIFRKKLIEEIKKLPGETVKEKIIHNDTSTIYEQLLDFISCIDEVQYKGYKKLTEKQRKVVLLDIVEDNLYIKFHVDQNISEDNMDDNIVIKRLKAKGYSPKKDKVLLRFNGKNEYTVNKTYISRQYMFMLNKTGDDWLAVSTARLNPFTLPVSPSKTLKSMMLYNATPVKIGSETDLRFFAAYAGEEALAEFRDRNLSVPTLLHMCDVILTTDKPTDIDDITPRDKVPFGNETVVNIHKSITNTFGYGLELRENNED